jgi:hypothetical protein
MRPTRLLRCRKNRPIRTRHSMRNHHVTDFADLTPSLTATVCPAYPTGINRISRIPCPMCLNSRAVEPIICCCFGGFCRSKSSSRKHVTRSGWWQTHVAKQKTFFAATNQRNALQVILVCCFSIVDRGRLPSSEHPFTAIPRHGGANASLTGASCGCRTAVKCPRFQRIAPCVAAVHENIP